MPNKKKTPAKKEHSSESMKKLKLAIDKMEKDFGRGIIMLLGEKPVLDDNTVSTGSLGLDISLGIGGLPRGRIIEIYGPESSGKTTMAQHVIANAQKTGGLTAIIDAEHAFDTAYAVKLGIDIDKLLISQPDYGEQALEVLDRLLSTGEMDVIVIDSVAALVPKAELEGEMGDSKMGLHARLMGQAMRKIAAKVDKTNTIVIFINQLREKIGVLWGSPETTTGGNALKFYASVRLDIRKISQVKIEDEIIGNRVKVKVVKNKVGPPFRAAEFEIRFGEGIDIYSEMVEASAACGVVLKNGSWYSYNNDKLGQGAEAVRQLFIDNPELFQEIKEKVKDKFFNNQTN